MYLNGKDLVPDTTQGFGGRSEDIYSFKMT